MRKRIGYILIGILILWVGQMTFEAHYRPSFYNRFRDIPDISTHENDKKLTLSGSSSYVIGHLRNKFKTRSTPIYVIDLQEKDTDFINNYPQHWLGYDKNRLHHSWPNNYKYLSRRLILTGKLFHENDFRSAHDVVSGQGLIYISLLQTRKKVPDQRFVDKLIGFLRSVPNDAHLHVYCREGKGRTSLILLMIDIWRTQAKIPLNELVSKHHLAGSEDLLDTTLWEGGTYTAEMLQNRKNFVVNFYHDVRNGKYPL
jgi:hypothetical protein